MDCLNQSEVDQLSQKKHSNSKTFPAGSDQLKFKIELK